MKPKAIHRTLQWSGLRSRKLKIGLKRTNEDRPTPLPEYHMTECVDLEPGYLHSALSQLTYRAKQSRCRDSLDRIVGFVRDLWRRLRDS